MAYLSAHNLSVGYKHKGNVHIVLSDLNITLERGCLVSLLGANGAGKSTLLRTITGVQVPLAGDVMMNDAQLNTLSQRERSRLIGIVTTDRIMAGGLTVTELVSLGRQPHTGFWGRLSSSDKERVREAMHDAGIEHKANYFVSQLSDGERQKAMIAKSLAQRTPIIVLDEPTAFLDVASRFETMRLLHDLAHKHNKAVLLSSHDISLSLLLSDKLWIIDSNRQFIAGGTEDLILNGTLSRMFNSDALTFSHEMGDFEMSLPTSHAVSLECSSVALKRCITNALMRNGIAVQPEAKVCITAIASGSAYSINIGSQSLTTIEELIKTLKSNTLWT
ncbi:MAG: ABC transporter ATP-binding protein [Muribaculaceae bacterium]